MAHQVGARRTQQEVIVIHDDRLNTSFERSAGNPAYRNVNRVWRGSAHPSVNPHELHLHAFGYRDPVWQAW
jgi:hypothetical protein